MRLLSLGTILISSLLLVLGGCKPSAKRGEFKSGIEGVYVGNLPCQNCDGEQIHATFYPNQDVAITSCCVSEDSDMVTTWGIWRVDSGVLAVTFGEKTFHYIQLSDTLIQMSDSVGKKIEDKEYQLSRRKAYTAKDFNGIYSMGDLNSDNGYVQTLDISPISSSKVMVEFSGEGDGRSCSFKGEGVVVNGHIEIDLAPLNNKMNSKVIIQFIGEQQIKVSSSRKLDRFDLMYFCSGGGSLAGEYTLVDN